MLSALIAFVRDHDVGNIASVVGVMLSLLGFSVTVWNVVRSKRAAEQTEKAVKSVRDRLTAIDTIADFSSAIAIMDEIKRLHRQGAWVILPDRYSALKKALVSSMDRGPDQGRTRGLHP